MDLDTNPTNVALVSESPNKPKILKKTDSDMVQGSKKDWSEKELIIADSSKELVPSKSCILKRLRKSSDDSYSFVRKAQLNRKGLKIHEIPARVYPDSKKRRAEDVVKHISKKSKKRKLVIRDESSDSEIVPDTPLALTSPKVSTPIISSLSSPTTTIFSIISTPLEIGVTKSVS